MDRYQCHKQVDAAKIVRVEGYLIDGVTLHFADGTSHACAAAWSLKHTPGEGQYFVRYDDGYESILPPQAFEDGYTLITRALTDEDAAADLAGEPRPDNPGFESSGPVSA